MPAALVPFIDVWKRPEKLVNGMADIPVAELRAGEDDKAPKGGATGREMDLDLFAGNDCLEWLLDVMRCIRDLDATVEKGHYLYESIYPKGSDGLPAVSPSGRYQIRCFVMDQWRCVTVDDLIPVDLFGRTVLVGSRPLVTWPLLLTKAVLKLMNAFGILDRASCAQVPAEIWLTGWVQEALGRSANAGNLLDGVLYDRIDRSLPVATQNSTCALIERAAPDRPPPRMIVLCGPSGVGKGAFMRRLIDEMGEIFGACCSHTTRKPKEHEVEGDPCNGYFFVSRPSFEKDVEEELFLEHMKYDKLDKENFPRYAEQLYGTALATVRDIAAVGKLCVVGCDHNGVASLKARPGVDCLTIYVAPPSQEELERRLRGRFHEAESTIQKRLEWAAVEMENGIEKEKNIMEAKDAKKGDKKAPPDDTGKFDFVLSNNNMDSVYMAMKESIATISPVIRNRLRGLPAYVLDYSDLIPANSVEEAFNKPVAVAGPVTTDKKDLFKLLIEEFDDVFGFAPLTTTMNPEDFALDKNYPEVMQKRKFVSDEEFDQLVAEGKLIEHRSAKFIHESLIYRMGTHVDDVKEVVEIDERICLIDCEVEGANQVQAYGGDYMSIFLMPPSIEEYESRVRKWLSYTDEQIAGLMASAKELEGVVNDNSDFDVKLVNDTFDESYQGFLDIMSRYRPDIITPPEEREVVIEETKPVIICGPFGAGANTLVSMVKQDIPHEVVVPVGHTTRAPKPDEENGVNFHFTDKKAMLEMINAGEFAEYYEYPPSGSWPPEGQDGTPENPITEQPPNDLFGVRTEAIKEITVSGKICLFETDMSSAAKFRETELGSTGLFVYVSPPSYEVLEKRLKLTRPEDMDDETFHARLVNAKMDVKRYEAQYDGTFENVIVNHDVPSAYCELRRLLGDKCEPAGVVSHLPMSLVLSGPFGPSKQQIIRRMCETYPTVFEQPIAHTTREPRLLEPPVEEPTDEDAEAAEGDAADAKEAPAPAAEGEEEAEVEEPPKEEDGVHFHFSTTEEMEEMLAEVRFLPGAGKVVVPTVVAGGDDDVQMYGISYASIAAVAAAGKICIIDADSVEDSRLLRELEDKPQSFRAQYVFANHPSEEIVKAVLEHAGLSAGTEPEVVESQVAEAWGLVSAEGTKGMANDGEIFDRTIGWVEDDDAQYMELLQYLSENNPSLISAPSVWGYGRCLWDEASRTYGQRPLRIVILGPAASGKSTQAFKICEEYGVPYVNMGELVQQEVRAKTALGIEMKKYLDATQTVPNGPILEIMKKRLFQPDCMKRGYVMDGFPHRDEQWAAMDAYGVAPDKVIILESTFEKLIERIEGRRIDPVTGYVYHLEHAPPVKKVEGSEEEEIDMEIADRLTVRHDDSKKNVRNRLTIYDHADAVLRSGFAPVSKSFDAELGIKDIYESLREFVMAEDLLKDEVKVLPSRSLEKLQYQIVRCEKYQRMCCLKLKQSDGRKTFWCDLADIAGNTSHIHVSFEPNSLSCRHEVQHLDLSLPTVTEVIYVDSLEPVNLLCSLAVGIQTLFRMDLDPSAIKDAEDATAGEEEGGAEGESAPTPPPPPPSLKLAAPALVFVQPRGSGGDRVLDLLLQDFPLKFARAAKHTSRPPAEGEVGTDFLVFSSRAAIDAETVLESVVGEDEHVYATTLASAQTAASPPLPALPRMAVIETDVAGAHACRALGLDAVYIFVQPTSDLTLDTAIREELDRELNPGETIDEELAMERIRRGQSETSKALASDSPFDHIIRNTLDLRSYRTLKAHLAARWPRSTEPHECHMLLELFSWSDGSPPKVVMRRHTPTNVASTVPLMRGKHLLKMTCSESHVYDASFRSATDFELGDASDMLSNKEGVHCHELTGDYEEQVAGAWTMLFRQRFKVPSDTTVHARLYVNDPIVSQYCHLLFVDNDTGAIKTCPSGLCLEAVPQNEHGYTLLCYASFTDAAKTGSWRLAFASSQELPLFEPVPNTEDYRFEGAYVPNKKVFISRHAVRVKSRCQLALHYETNLPCRYELSVREPDSTLGELDEAPGPNEPVHYVFDGCTSPFLRASLNLDGPTSDESAERVYIVQAKLQPHLNSFAIHPNGNLLDDVYSAEEGGLSWKLACYVTDAAEVAEDDARDAWHRRLLDKWNEEGAGGAAERPKKAEGVMGRVEGIAAALAEVAAYEAAAAAEAEAAEEEGAAGGDKGEAPEPPPPPAKPGREEDEFFAEELVLPVETVIRPIRRAESGENTLLVLKSNDYEARENVEKIKFAESGDRWKGHSTKREHAASEREVLKGRTAVEFTEWRASMLAQRAEVEAKRAALLEARRAAAAPAPAAEEEAAEEEEEAAAAAAEAGGEEGGASAEEAADAAAEVSA